MFVFRTVVAEALGTFHSFLKPLLEKGCQDRVSSGSHCREVWT